jgi:hypothetical protein
MIYSKIIKEAIKNMISNTMSSFNHVITDSKDLPCSKAPVAFTEAMTTGTINGYKRMGSMISLVLNEADMADIRVPRATNPSVPIKVIKHISIMY